MHPSPYAPSVLSASILSSSHAKTTTANRAAFEASLAFLAGIGLFLSVIVSDVFVIMDMCCGGLRVEESIVPSPLSVLELTWSQMLTLYIVSSTIVVASGVVLMLYDLPKSAIVMKMVPAILIVNMAGYGLRSSGRFSHYVAYLYLFVGSLLVAMAAIHFMNTGMSLGEYQSTPLIYSFCLQGGLILAIAAALSIE